MRTDGVASGFGCVHRIRRRRGDGPAGRFGPWRNRISTDGPIDAIVAVMPAITRIQTFLLLALACSTPAWAIELTPVELDSAPGSAQPSVAVDPGRGFIVTWQTRGERGAQLRHALVDRNGRLGGGGVIADSTTSGADGGAATWFVNWADFPSLVVLDNGDWVTHWLQKTSDGTYAYEIRVVRSSDRGRTWSAPVVPHTDGTATEHGFVAMLPAGGERVRLVWLDGRETAVGGHGHGGHDHGADAPMTLRTAVLDRAGNLHEEAELDASTCSCCQTDAVRVGARSVFAYRDVAEGNLRNIHAIAHADGTWSADRAIHDDGWRIAGCPVNGPALASDGRAVLALWPTMQDDRLVVRMAVDRGGGYSEPVDLEAEPGTIGRVDAAAWPGGRWLAAWIGAGTEPGASVQRLAEIGAGPAVTRTHDLVHLPPGRATGVPRLAAEAGVGLMAWVDATGAAPTVRAMRIAQAEPGR